jgi:hypothetical protein
LLLSIAAKPSPNYFSTNGEGFVWVGALSLWDSAFTVEYWRVVKTERVSLLYRVSDGPSINIFDGDNIFPIIFASFYIFVELSPVLALVFNIDIKRDYCAFYWLIATDLITVSVLLGTDALIVSCYMLFWLFAFKRFIYLL